MTDILSVTPAVSKRTPWIRERSSARSHRSVQSMFGQSGQKATSRLTQVTAGR
jgi:hypothetical protein